MSQPTAIDRLIEKARGGDYHAARYLYYDAYDGSPRYGEMCKVGHEAFRTIAGDPSHHFCANAAEALTRTGRGDDDLFPPLKDSEQVREEKAKADWLTMIEDGPEPSTLERAELRSNLKAVSEKFERTVVNHAGKGTELEKLCRDAQRKLANLHRYAFSHEPR